MTKLPWFLSLFFALLALWSLTRSSAKIHKMAEITGSSKPVTPTSENVDLSTLHRAMEKVQQGDSIQTVEDNTIRELLQHPVVQQHIEAEVKQRVQTQANRLAKQEVDNLKREQREEKIAKTNAYMDGLESFFMNSINVYAEEFEIEQPVADELGDIIELGFQKQRELYDQLMNEQLTEEDYKARSGEAKQADKEAIESLLGEDGAEDFNTILYEEGRKARESQK
jgi:hypothetical protein